MSITPSPEVLRMQRDDGTMYRSAVVTVAPKDDATETRAISLAISSEAPVLRYDWRSGGMFWEVLAHGDNTVDLSRAASGLPLCMGHDQRHVVGRALGISVDTDGVLRAADTTFSRSQSGRDALMDVEDGILTDTSVGYVVGDAYEETKAEDAEYPTRTYTRWTPFEVSLVAVPADPSVGVGRSAPPVPSVRAIADAEPATVPVIVATVATPQGARMSAGADGAATTSRTDFILSACDAAKVDTSTARALIASDKSEADITRELVGIVEARHTAKSQLATDLTEKESRQYSLVAALNSLANGRRDGFEFEVSDTIAKEMGKETRGLYFPSSLPNVGRNGQRTLLSVGNKANTKAGESVFTEFGGFIDLLRNRMVSTAVGVEMIGGVQGDLSFVNQSAAASATWGTETANAGLSSLSTAVRTVAPKVLQSATSYSRQLLRQSSIDIENLVRNDLATIHALAIDLAVFRGLGTSNQPRGILNTAGIGSVVGGANGLQPTYDHIVDLQKEVAIDNALFGSVGYVVHPLIAARLMKTQQFASTNGVPVWTGNIMDGSVGGFSASATTQFETGITKGTSTDISPILFGDFSAAKVFEWGAVEVLVDPLTIGPSQVKIMAIQMVDVFVRYPEKFAAMLDARI